MYSKFIKAAALAALAAGVAHAASPDPVAPNYIFPVGTLFEALLSLFR
ncbi:MAG: hypothetical protein HZC37_16280 [Burkholderiales bacterium]|nr:hypothetical protein [Burkholderiales bacterium]